MSLIFETVLIAIFLIITHISIYLWLRKVPKKSIRDRHVVITGGSSGIGLGLAIQCVKLGAHVTIIARNVTNLGNYLLIHFNNSTFLKENFFSFV